MVCLCRPPPEAFTSRGWLEGSLKAAELMQQQGTPITRNYAYLMLRECEKLQDVECCRRVQLLMAYSRLESVGVLADHLVRVFGWGGRLAEANKAFNKVARPTEYTWSAIIDAHASLGQGERALHLYDKMQRSGLRIGKYSYVAALKACASTSNIDRGRLIHKQIMKSGIRSDIMLGNTLVAMYSKCGDFEEARKVFDNMPHRDVVSWGALITGHAQHGEGLLALEYFEQMQLDGIKPNKVIFVSMLRACATVGAIEQGKLIQKQIIKDGCQLDVFVSTALVDMYAKCGILEEASRIFSGLSKKDVIAWSAMIAGYAQCGDFKNAKQYFDDMLHEGIRPDEVTFTSILAACNQAGLLDEGRRYYKLMKHDYGIIPNSCHNNCMAEMLGQAGYLKEAEVLLQTNQSDVIGWMSLLIACKTFRDFELARRCFDQIVQFDVQTPAAYVVMSSIYTDAGLQDNALKVEGLRQSEAAWKRPAKAWIEVADKVHEFVVGDKTHSRHDEVTIMLNELNIRIKEVEANRVLQSISAESLW